MMYLGDFDTAATVYFLWNSNGADGASITRATNGTISVYKNNGTTQTTTGVTDTEDFDGLTGVHAIAIDTSADGTFYSAGGQFAVVLSAATIDGKTVNAVLAQFSLERTPKVNVTKFGGTAGTFASGRPEVNASHIAGSAVSTSSAQIGVNVVNAAGTAWGSGAITATVLASDCITAAKIAADAIGASELAADAVAEIAAAVAAPGSTAIADAVWDEVASGHVTAGTFGAFSQAMRANTAQTGAAGTITLDASASSVNDYYNDSGVAIISGTGAGQARRISDYVGSTKVATITPNWNTNPDNTSVFVIFPGWQASVTSTEILTSGTAQAGAAGTITLASGASSTSSLFVGLPIRTTGGTGAGQARVITAYNGSTKVATVDWSWTTTPDNTTTYEIIGQPTPKLNSSVGVTLASTGLDAIATTAPSGVASTFREMVVQTWRRFFKKAYKSSTQLITYADDGTTVVTTQSISETSTTQTQGTAT